MCGSDLRHGGHQVAQKSISTTLPFSLASETCLPSSVDALKAGACLPSSAVVSSPRRAKPNAASSVMQHRAVLNVSMFLRFIFPPSRDKGEFICRRRPAAAMLVLARKCCEVARASTRVAWVPRASSQYLQADNTTDYCGS